MTEKAVINTDNARTIFDLNFEERQEAFNNLVSGTTPKDAIKYREGRGVQRDKDGKVLKGTDGRPLKVMVPYVKGAWLERQIGLITGFRWTAEVLEEKSLPDWWQAVERIRQSPKEDYTKAEVVDMLTRIIHNMPKEIGAKVKVTIYDKDGHAYSQTNMGGSEVKYYGEGEKKGQPLSIMDDIKAAITDGKKKCIVDFGGFANDVYGGREIMEE